ncbi:unnamed protein product, partial [Rotaria magnacalcarata]
MQMTWEAAPYDIKERWGDTFYKELYQIVDNDPSIRNAENPVKVIEA